VLQWIKSSPYILKTFVAKAEIQTKTNTTDWRHVSSVDNPADLISRVQTPKEFLRPTIWKKGPEWLQQNEHRPSWNPTPLVEVPEQKRSTCLIMNTIDHATNLYESQKLGIENPQNLFRLTVTNKNTMKRFFGLILWMGLVRLSFLRLY
jgi:hypothetical protein